MKIEQRKWMRAGVWTPQHAESLQESAQLVLLFGSTALLDEQHLMEEVEGVRQVLGNDAILAGFYSYGEISPFSPGAQCELHNQTMTITVLSEDNWA